MGGGGGQDVETLVFTNVALQTELKITEAQKEKMKPVTEKFTDLNKKRMEMFKEGFDKEKFSELRDEGKKIAEEAKKLRDEVLTDGQKKRLKQIEIQVMGFSVFNDPDAKAGKGGFGGPSEEHKALMKEVQDILKLTDGQKSTIKGVVSEYNKESREIFKEAGFGGKGGGGKGGFDFEKMAAVNKKVEKIRKESMEKIEEAFDDTQKKAWKELVGDAFDTSKLRPAPPAKKD